MNAYIEKSAAFARLNLRKIRRLFHKGCLQPREAIKWFERFIPSRRNGYIGWITDAKRVVTRDGRIARALEWRAEDKPRTWKYMKKK